jgi:opacity protein-like surface antigen
MRKVFITTMIVCGFFAGALAQAPVKFVPGVEAGFNTSYVQDTNSGANSDAVLGVNLGVTGDYYFTDHWSLKAKLLYDQKGWGNGYLVGSDGSQITGINFKLDYLTLPVVASFHFGRLRNFYIDFGPYLGVLLSASDNNSDPTVKSYFNNADFGFDFGIGVKFPISKKVKFFIEGEAQAGVLSIINQGGGNSFESERSSLNVGFDFPMGK